MLNTTAHGNQLAQHYSYSGYFGIDWMVHQLDCHYYVVPPEEGSEVSIH